MYHNNASKGGSVSHNAADVVVVADGQGFPQDMAPSSSHHANHKARRRLESVGGVRIARRGLTSYRAKEEMGFPPSHDPHPLCPSGTHSTTPAGTSHRRNGAALTTEATTLRTRAPTPTWTNLLDARRPFTGSCAVSRQPPPEAMRWRERRGEGWRRARV